MNKKLARKIIVYVLLVFLFLFLYLSCSDKNAEMTMFSLAMVGTVTIVHYIGKFTDWLFDEKEEFDGKEE